MNFICVLIFHIHFCTCFFSKLGIPKLHKIQIDTNKVAIRNNINETDTIKRQSEKGSDKDNEIIYSPNSSKECECVKKAKSNWIGPDTTERPLTPPPPDPCANVCKDLPKDDVEPVCMMFSRYKKAYHWFMNHCHARSAICRENLDLHLVHPSRCMKSLQFFMPIV